MATCAPTARARALTFLNLVQARAAHAANVRTLPKTGGVEATSARRAAAVGAARRAVAAPDACARPRARSVASKRVAVARSDDGASRCASGIAAAVNVAARS